LDTEHGETVGSHVGTNNSFGISLLLKVRGVSSSGDHKVENVRSFAQVFEFLNRPDSRGVRSDFRKLGPNGDNAVGALIGPGIQ